jgi:hypothetical protein
MGIDMSKAFDCINREKLLETIRPLIAESEYRIIQYLLSETVLRARIDGKFGDKFGTTIGTPQGDALSPVLFVVYLERALRDVRYLYNNDNGRFHMKTEYADDTDFICTETFNNNLANAMLPGIMANFNLQINQDKTEFIMMKPGEDLNTKKLGSIIDSNKDIEYRITQSKRAFKECWKIRNSKRVRTSTKVRMYNAFIKPILTYNLGATAATTPYLNKIDRHHRQQLRHVIGIHYPEHIDNVELYRRTNTTRISAEISIQRTKFLGHVLRRDPLMPANQATNRYFDIQKICQDGRYAVYSAKTIATKSKRTSKVLPINFRTRLT